MVEKSVKDCALERLDLLVLRLNLERDIVVGQFDNRVKFMYGDNPSKKELANAYHCVVEYFEERVK
jgi:hypothetical protein